MGLRDLVDCLVGAQCFQAQLRLELRCVYLTRFDGSHFFDFLGFMQLKQLS